MPLPHLRARAHRPRGERHARVESIRKRATKLSVRRKTGKAHGPPVVLWASKAWTLDRAASAAFAKCGAGDAAGNAPALRRLRVWDPARKSGGKTFRSGTRRGDFGGA